MTCPTWCTDPTCPACGGAKARVSRYSELRPTPGTAEAELAECREALDIPASVYVPSAIRELQEKVADAYRAGHEAAIVDLVEISLGCGLGDAGRYLARRVRSGAASEGGP